MLNEAEVRLTLVPNHCPSSDEVETDMEKAGKPNDVFEFGSVFVPTNARAGIIFCDEHLLESARI